MYLLLLARHRRRRHLNLNYINKNEILLVSPSTLQTITDALGERNMQI